MIGPVPHVRIVSSHCRRPQNTRLQSSLRGSADALKVSPRLFLRSVTSQKLSVRVTKAVVVELMSSQAGRRFGSRAAKL